MTYPGERPHAFVQVEPGVLWPEFCGRCGDVRDHPIHIKAETIMTDSRDEDGHYCGQNEDGTAAVIPMGKVGYCGPECLHCVGSPVYVLQDGVWVCAADFDHEELVY